MSHGDRSLAAGKLTRTRNELEADYFSSVPSVNAPQIFVAGRCSLGRRAECYDSSGAIHRLSSYAEANGCEF